MKKASLSLFAVLRNGVCIVLVLLVLLVAPTGWLYDLWAGEGAEQGQRPNEDVQQQEDIETCYSNEKQQTCNNRNFLCQ